MYDDIYSLFRPQTMQFRFRSNFAIFLKETSLTGILELKMTDWMTGSFLFVNLKKF